MATIATPLDYWRAGLTFWQISAEAQMVIGMRVLGMMNLWRVTGGEDKRMVSEKTAAMGQAARAMAGAAMVGKRPDQIAVAGMKPIRAKTAGNVARLAKRGPKLPGLS